MTAHVSVYEDRPPHDTMHEIDDYPLYYDALYFLELYHIVNCQIMVIGRYRETWK